MLDYECPNCGEELEGDFGENVFCEKCNKTYETQYDYGGNYDLMCWITKEILK